MSAMFLEPDHDRLVRRIAAVSGGDLTTSQITSVVDGDTDLLKELSAPSKQKVAALVAPNMRGELEKIVGPTTDFVPISFIERALIASNAVARVLDGRRRPLGTGVMVSPQLFMTNNHVIADSQTGTICTVQFNYQLGLDDIPEVVTEFRLDPATFFWTSPQDVLDTTVIAIGERMGGEQPLAHFGWTALSSAGDKHAEGDHVTVIEHPDADYKQIALRENRVIGRGKKGVTLYYSADTLAGSSGSPVFNDEFAIVALHHAGGQYNDDHLENGDPVPGDVNEGIRVSAIVDALRKRHDELPAPFRNLLAEVLNPPTATTPLEKIARAAVHADPLPTALASLPDVDAVPTLVTADLHLPRLRINSLDQPRSTVDSERLFAPTVMALTTSNGPATVAGRNPGDLERNDAPDQDYGNRRGYDPEFLSRTVAVPTVPKDVLAVCALPTGQRRSKSAVLLPYNRFSLVIHATRRMPLFTIVNIDGRRLRTINRKTGAIEAAETWYQDPRLAPETQLDQSIFDAQRPRLFDRGHMVRRLDPAWGSPSTAKVAANDTFHFTNCCPQISDFNQHLWLSIEGYARDNAGTEKRQITVITGPVFAETDPTYRGIKVPRSFWKVVVRVSDTDGALRATGFLADQGAALDAAFGDADGPEAFVDLGAVVAFQTTISEIETRSGLSFNGLNQHDTKRVGLEAAPTELVSLTDVTW